MIANLIKGSNYKNKFQIKLLMHCLNFKEVLFFRRFDLVSILSASLRFYY